MKTVRKFNMDIEQLKKQNEELKKEIETLKKSRPDVAALEATIKELYANYGSKRVTVKVFQKRNGIPVMLRIVSTKDTDSGVAVEVAGE